MRIYMQEGVRFVNTEAELRACYQLRHKIYVEGMNRFTDKSDHNLKELQDEQDKNARAIIAIKNNIPIGTLRLFWGGDHSFTHEQTKAYQITAFKPLLQEKQMCIVERLMVDDIHRGTVTALRMYKEVMNFVLMNQLEVVLLDCEPHHIEAYLKLGFKPFAKQYNYPGIGPVIPMALIVGDYNHLKSVGSPFYTLVTKKHLNYCRHTDALKKIMLLESESTCQSSTYKDKIEKSPTQRGICDNYGNSSFTDKECNHRKRAAEDGVSSSFTAEECSHKRKVLKANTSRLEL